MQSGLLNEIDQGVDKTTSGLKTQTKRAEKLMEDSGGCCGLCIILVLMGVIAMLALTNWACHVFNEKKC